MKRFQLFLAAGLLGSLAGKPASAVLIPLADPVFGADALTRDTGTGLDWLDLTFSVGQIYVNVAGEFGPGGDFAGFRHATIAEVVQLFTNAGIPVIDNGGSPENNAPAVALIALVGATSHQDGNPEARGFTSSIMTGVPGTRRNGDLDFVLSAPSYYDVRTGISRSETLIFPNVAHWLVRAVLPGDYDLDGDVDLNDYGVWRATFGSTTALAADGNFDGRVDAADYIVWRNATSASTSLGADAWSVPECAAPWTMTLGALTLVVRGSFRRRRVR